MQSCNQSSFKAYEEYLHLVQDAVTFKGACYELKSFLEAMQKTLCYEDTHKRDISAAKPLKKELKSRINDSFWNHPKRLFDSLVTHLQPCSSARNSAHSAMLHLKGFTDATDHPELSILFACPDRNTYWQQMHCSVSSQSRYTNSQADICRWAQESYRQERILKIELDGDKFLDMSDLVYGQEPDCLGADHMVSLNDLLKLGLLKDRNRFFPNDKKILAYLLALSLLCLHEGPWIQTLWTLDKLLYRCHTTDSTQRKVYNIHQPYILCVFLEKPPTPGTLSGHDYPSILSFAKLLVELETGEEIKGLAKNEKSEFKALMHYRRTWSKHQLSQEYANAFDACVLFQKYFKEDRLRNPQIKIQEVILKRIVSQLEMGINLDRKEWGVRHLDVPIESQEHTQDFPQAALPVDPTSISTTNRIAQNTNGNAQPTDSGHIRKAQGPPKSKSSPSVPKAQRRKASQSASLSRLHTDVTRANVQAADSRHKLPSRLGILSANKFGESSRSVTESGRSMGYNQQHNRHASCSDTNPLKVNKSQVTKGDASAHNSVGHNIQRSYGSDVQASQGNDNNIGK